MSEIKKENSEVMFLHDVSNPLAAAIYLVDSMVEDLKENPPLPTDLARMERVSKSLSRVKDILQERKKTLSAGKAA